MTDTTTAEAPVRYMHFRVLDESGEPLPRGGATAAYTLTPESKGRVRVRCAFAACSLVDDYRKRIGRVKARGRLRSDKCSREWTYCEPRKPDGRDEALAEFVDIVTDWWKRHQKGPVPVPFSSSSRLVRKNRKAAS